MPYKHEIWIKCNKSRNTYAYIEYRIFNDELFPNYTPKNNENNQDKICIYRSNTAWLIQPTAWWNWIVRQKSYVTHVKWKIHGKSSLNTHTVTHPLSFVNNNQMKFYLINNNTEYTNIINIIIIIIEYSY